MPVIADDGEKRCSGCRQTMVVAGNFYRCPSKSTGWGSYCIACAKKRGAVTEASGTYQPMFRKTCRGCGKRKRAKGFYRRPAVRTGLSSFCRECQKTSAKKSDARDILRTRAKKKRWKKDHPEETKARQRVDSRRAYKRHGEKLRAGVRAYAAANRDKIKARYTSPRGRLLRRINQSRRNARLRAAADTLTATQWETIVEVFGGLCAYCAAPWEHIDHVVPVSRGGGTEAGNVVPACLDCNVAKNARSLEDFCAERGLDAAVILERAAGRLVDAPPVLAAT